MILQLNKSIILHNKELLEENIIVDKVGQMFDNIFKYSTTHKEIYDKQEKDLVKVEQYLKTRNISINDLKNKALKDITIIDGKFIINDAMQTFIKDLKKTTPKDIFVSLMGVLLIVILNSSVQGLLLKLFIKAGVESSVAIMVASKFSSIIVAPIVEEAYKASSIKHNKGGIGVFIFNIIEFFLYISRLQTETLPKLLLGIVARIVSFISHYGEALIHRKGHLEQLLNNKYNLNKKVDFRKESKNMSMMLHGLWNAGAAIPSTLLQLKMIDNDEK
jgi:hypothetical protein